MGVMDIKVSFVFVQSKYIMGGIIMGLDVVNLVVDFDCCVYDYDNLFLFGGGVMFSMVCGNSILSMVVLGLKVVDVIVC